MSKSNYCFLTGNLGMDPVERSRGPKGGSIVGFTVAENVNAFDEETKTYKTIHTNWFNVTAFGSLGDRALGSLKKGDRVSVQGRMRTSKFTDRNGDERTGFEIIADDVAKLQLLASAAPAPKKPVASPGSSSRAKLNSEFPQLLKAFLGKYPKTRFEELLRARYGVGDTRMMTVEQLEDMIEFMKSSVQSVA